jgi:hypothetical protein
METQTITNQKGYTFHAFKFEKNPRGIYQIQDILRTLTLEKMISEKLANQIFLMKSIEDQLTALKPFKKFLEDNL